MPSFHVTVNHSLTRDAAIARLRDYSLELENEYGNQVSHLEKQWDDRGNMIFSFRAMGFSFKGEMVAGESDVTIRGSLPLLALPLKGMIEHQVAQHLEQTLQGEA